MTSTGRTINEWTPNDIIALIENQTPQSDQLVYLENFEGTPEDIRAVLQGVVGLANSYGGCLILGIRANDCGCAQLISGTKDLLGKRSRILEIIDQWIQPAIEEITLADILFENNSSALVLYIPPSHKRPHMTSIDGHTDFYLRCKNSFIPMTFEEITSAILENYSPNENISTVIGFDKPAPRKMNGYETPYLKLYTSNGVEQFIRRFMFMENHVQSLLIISPFIGDLENELVSLKDILDRGKKASARIYVVTRQPNEPYQLSAMSVISRYSNVEVRYNADIHAKLYVCWSRVEEESFAFFGSGNLTVGGMSYNIELGMMILSKGKGKALVDQLYKWGSSYVRTAGQCVKAITSR